MIQSSRSSKSQGHSANVKLFVTAASLAATVGGWAWLSRPDTTITAAPPPAEPPAAIYEALELQVSQPDIPAVPTLIPAPGNLAIPQAAQQAQQAPAKPTQAPRAAAPAPVPQQPQLRSVQRPSIANRPAPVTTSRSSR